MQNYFLKKFNTTTEQILAVSKLINNHIDLTNIENQILPTTEQKLCLSLISKLNGNELTENQINDMTLNNIKNIITQFLKQYSTEQLNEMAKDFFEKDKQNEINEIKRIKKEQQEFETEQDQKQTNETEQHEEETNFYDLFRF